MNTVQKIVGKIYSPYRFSLLGKENTLLITSIINSLPNKYNVLKEELNESRVLNLDDWKLMPEYRFITKSYSEIFLKKFKKRGVNYKLSGLNIYSKRTHKFERIELLIWENLLSGILIENSLYDLTEFDLKQIKIDDIQETAITFPPTDIDIFLDSIEESIKEKLDIESVFDIDFNPTIRRVSEALICLN